VQDLFLHFSGVIIPFILHELLQLLFEHHDLLLLRRPLLV